MLNSEISTKPFGRLKRRLSEQSLHKLCDIAAFTAAEAIKVVVVQLH